MLHAHVSEPSFAVYVAVPCWRSCMITRNMTCFVGRSLQGQARLPGRAASPGVCCHGDASSHSTRTERQSVPCPTQPIIFYESAMRVFWWQGCISRGLRYVAYTCFFSLLVSESRDTRQSFMCQSCSQQTAASLKGAYHYHPPDHGSWQAIRRVFEHSRLKTPSLTLVVEEVFQQCSLVFCFLGVAKVLLQPPHAWQLCDAKGDPNSAASRAEFYDHRVEGATSGQRGRL